MNEEWRLTAAVLVGLGLFGFLYDRWVERLEAHGMERGFLSLIVSLGCMMVIGGFLLWTGDLWATVKILLCFVSSGIFMIQGSIRRYVRHRLAEEKRSRAEARAALDDD